MTTTRNDTQGQLDAIWEVLAMARETCIPEDGNGPYDEQWQDVCDAMAWIAEDLGADGPQPDRQYHVVFTCQTFAATEAEAMEIAKAQVAEDSAHAEVTSVEADAPPEWGKATEEQID